MNGCIYRTKDGECDLYAEGGKYTAFCEMENCKGRKMSNADRIRSMTDEELAEFLLDSGSGFLHGHVLPYMNVSAWLAWMREEVSE